jgi:hypothetical protein
VNPNPLGVAAILLSIVLFAGTYIFLRARPKHVRAAWLVTFVILSIPSFFFAIYYLHLLPEWSWFYTLRSWRGTELLSALIGGAMGSLGALLPRCVLLLPLSVSLVITVAPYVKPVLGPLPERLIAEQWRGRACIQSTASTCGPASLCTIFKFLGRDVSERAVAHAAYSYGGGTEAWYLARYARNQGFTPRFEFRHTFTPDAGLPSVVGVTLGDAGHFIAVLSVDNDRVTFADPLWGESTIPLSDFLRKYHFTGFHMVVAKPALH